MLEVKCANNFIKWKAHKLPKNIKRSINFKQYSICA